MQIVDENTVLGKGFLGTPRPGREILTFSMSRKSQLEFMTEEDHEFLYGKMKKSSLESMVGIRTGRLISDTMWSDTMYRFRYYFDFDNKGGKY